MKLFETRSAQKGTSSTLPVTTRYHTAPACLHLHWHASAKPCLKRLASEAMCKITMTQRIGERCAVLMTIASLNDCPPACVLCSYMDELLVRRLGLPISLSVLYALVCREVQIPIEMIGMVSRCATGLDCSLRVQMLWPCSLLCGHAAGKVCSTVCTARWKS